MCQYMIRLNAWMYPLYVPLTLSGISLYSQIPRDRKHRIPQGYMGKGTRLISRQRKVRTEHGPENFGGFHGKVWVRQG